MIEQKSRIIVYSSRDSLGMPEETRIEGVNPQTDRARQRWQVSQEELVERIGRAVRDDGVIEPLKGLHLGRASVAHQKLHSALEPSFSLPRAARKFSSEISATSMIRSTLSLRRSNYRA